MAPKIILASLIGTNSSNIIEALKILGYTGPVYNFTTLLSQKNNVDAEKWNLCYKNKILGKDSEVKKILAEILGEFEIVADVPVIHFVKELSEIYCDAKIILPKFSTHQKRSKNDDEKEPKETEQEFSKNLVNTAQRYTTICINTLQSKLLTYLTSRKHKFANTLLAYPNKNLTKLFENYSRFHYSEVLKMAEEILEISSKNRISSKTQKSKLSLSEKFFDAECNAIAYSSFNLVISTRFEKSRRLIVFNLDETDDALKWKNLEILSKIDKNEKNDKNNKNDPKNVTPFPTSSEPSNNEILKTYLAAIQFYNLLIFVMVIFYSFITLAWLYYKDMLAGGYRVVGIFMFLWMLSYVEFGNLMNFFVDRKVDRKKKNQ